MLHRTAPRCAPQNSTFPKRPNPSSSYSPQPLQPLTGSTLFNSLLLCTVASFVGAAVLLLAFTLQLTFKHFLVVFSIGELMILAI